MGLSDASVRQEQIKLALIFSQSETLGRIEARPVRVLLFGPSWRLVKRQSLDALLDSLAEVIGQADFRVDQAECAGCSRIVCLLAFPGGGHEETTLSRREIFPGSGQHQAERQNE